MKEEVDRSITNNLCVPLAQQSMITIKSADKKVVQQDFQPIYDIMIEVVPSDGKSGAKTKMKGTRGQ